MERLMFRAVVQLKTVVHYYYYFFCLTLGRYIPEGFKKLKKVT